MKSFKLFLAFVMLVALGASAQTKAPAPNLNQAQKRAQNALYQALETKNYKPVIDTKDNTVTFVKGDKTYWISIEGKDDPLLYTIHTKGFSYKQNQKFTAEQRQFIAMLAASDLNAETSVKVMMKDGSVKFNYPLYAASVDQVMAVLPEVLRSLQQAKENFDAKYEARQKEYEAQIPPEDPRLIVEQPKEEVQQVAPALTLKEFQVRVVSPTGAEISAYDKGLRKNTCMFLQEAITATSERTGDITVGVRIYTPNGKLMLPTPEASYTTETVIQVKKAKKEATYELKKFGYEIPNQWEAGEYRIEFYDNGNMIYTGTFTVL